jgi:arylsulfatase A-like enzyme
MSTDQQPLSKRPNVIWVFGDQHRAQALGCSGDVNVHTPNIDNLAASGLHCTHAVSGYPLCCPYRGSLLTSIYPHKCVPGHEYPLPAKQRTIAHVFNDEGYHTAYIGKWHLDGFRENIQGRAGLHIVPQERRGGFQYWVGYENNNSQYDCWVHGGEGEGAFQYRLAGYETDELTGLMIDYIKQQGDRRRNGEEQPFFAVLSVQPPHNPYIAPGEFRKRHNPAGIQLRPNVPGIARIADQARMDLAGYYAMIENLDWNVGRLQQALLDSGLAQDTHVIFFSDHGDSHGSHGLSKKTNPYEESIRVPLIISAAQMVYGTRVGKCDAPLNHVDLAPTTLGLCGIEKPNWMEGTDYSTFRLGGDVNRANEPDSAYLQMVYQRGGNVDKPWRGLVTRDGWKYVCFAGSPWLMFDLNEDPYEMVNLAHMPGYHKKRKELNDRLRQWAADTQEDFHMPVM